MSKNSTGYIIFFATLVTLVAGVTLAVTATVLKPIQDKNKALEKKSFILKAAGYDLNTELSTPELIEEKYANSIEAILVDEDGSIIEGEDAFEIDPQKQNKLKASNPSYNIKLPIYKYDGEKGKQYVLPVSGVGLWGPIWGYVALDQNFETIQGVVYDHKSETPGLGAEITAQWFQEQFEGKKIKDEKNKLVSIEVKKGQRNELDMNSVDGMSGATVTSVGVENMLQKDFSRYQAYFKNIN